jgi:ATP-dependent RNA/DNA helicase IGHMBP2
VGENHNRRIQVQKPIVPAASQREVKDIPPESAVEATILENDAGEALSDRTEKINLNPDETSLEQKKRKKQKNSTLGMENPVVLPKDKPVKSLASPNLLASESVDNNIKCDDCKKAVPKQNLALHRLRCTGSGPTEQAVKPKQKLVVKPLPVQQTDRAKDLKVDKKANDIDGILSEFRQLDNVCNYATCKTGISLMGQQCTLCKRRFCLSHHLPEIHGCGDAIRRQARNVTLKQGFVAPGSLLVKPKPVDAAKRAHLQRKLDSKLEDMSTQRTGKKDGTKKKK